MSPGGLYFSHPACLEHDPRELSPGHPDTPERLIALERALAERDWLGWERRAAPSAQSSWLELAHSAAHVNSMRKISAAGGGAIDGDTFLGRRSFEAALHAAGGAVEMVGALLEQQIAVGYCGVRPSGHHAEHDRAMGFCVFNNVAIAAATAIAERGLSRVLVIDWDVHHGNGTAEIFRNRSDVLFASIHQSPLYPGTGPLTDVGSGAGEGYTINLPVPPGSGEALWLALFDRVVLPAARAFEPELILVSAGYDAHIADPLADCRLSTESFVAMAARARALSELQAAPLGLVQEGGYDSEVLADCVCAVMPAISDDTPPMVAPSAGAGEADALVDRAVQRLAPYWPLA
jgi:acetoin utilization deacetylase AcuC-like enzyme